MTTLALFFAVLSAPVVAVHPVHTYSSPGIPRRASLGLRSRHAEMIFWHAVALVNMKRLEESLPVFRRIFAMDPSWAALLPRLPRSGILPDDPVILDRILAESR